MGNLHAVYVRTEEAVKETAHHISKLKADFYALGNITALLRDEIVGKYTLNR
jgi:hypothetical protein